MVARQFHTSEKVVVYRDTLQIEMAGWEIILLVEK